ncbi:MAG: acetyl-CoA carboxylase biotin carboxyl carrier protein subunit [Bradymonadaceae bacterium]
MKSSQYFVTSGEEERRFEVETLEDGRYRVNTPEGDELIIDAYAPNVGQLHLLVGERAYDVDVRENGEGYGVRLGGEAHHVDVLNERQRRMQIAGTGGKKGGGPDLTSPMAGKVVAVNVEPGEVVDQGQAVIIIEAMKMENDLKAHKSGKVERVHVEAGQLVEIGDVLVTIDGE